MNQIANASILALSTCPKTSWEARVIRDFQGQRLALDTMKKQLLDQASRAQAKLFVMLIHWSLTGNWPRFRNAPIYFLKVVLQHAADQASWPSEADFPAGAPPWDPDYTAEFLDRTALSWFLLHSDAWAREIAGREFDSQEDQIKDGNPLF